MKNFQLKILFLLFFIASTLLAQTNTNYEVTEKLVKLSVQNLTAEMDTEKQYALNFIASTDYSILQQEVLQSLMANNISIVSDSASQETINYSIEEVKIDYPEIFRDGIFGNYLVLREGRIKASLYISDSKNIEQVKSFSKVVKDSVLYEDIGRLENIAYSFTTGKMPDEPFFASSLEPFIAVGSAAVAVYLLFNIRSK